jgi:pyruvate/2-oxoglutarate dehydrogenase complex dihydrolipoamide dehydrogenase (E3) component
LPQHLIVIGGGYSGLELAQAYRRFGSDVTIIESGPQLMGREDIDVSREMLRILSDEGMRVLLEAQLLEVRGRSLSFAHPLVSKTLMAVTSWSPLDAFRTPAESDFRMPALN